MQRILIVRLGSLGDLVHALPAVAGIRSAHPTATLDWLVDVRHREFLALVPLVDAIHEWQPPTVRAWRPALRTLGRLRAVGYDVAIDLQGLLKSATLARLSGARRVVGFSAGALREPAARRLYTEVVDPGSATHVIDKNRALVAAIGATPPAHAFPLVTPDSAVPSAVQQALGGESQRFALLNPGAAWPNKRWPAEQFGQLASHILDRHGMSSVVVWGPGERALAERVVQASGGCALLAPVTTVGDLVSLARAATCMVAGDTGPLHVAAAVGTPVVGIYGPTDPARNGPWAATDQVVSRYPSCECRYRRSCGAGAWCLASATLAEVQAAVDRRLERVDDDD
jgi:lipopolysaccharide heptosyltransferase I